MNRSLVNRTELALRAFKRAPRVNRAGKTLAAAPDVTKATEPTPSKATRLKLV
jgi:hypothetical protein